MASDKQRDWNSRQGGWTFNHGAKKLTPKQRDEIVKRYAEGGKGNSVEEMALEFGIAAATIRGMVKK